MKISEKIMIWFSPVLLAFISEIGISTDSIRIEYGGPQDKPIPTLVFFIDSLDKTGLFQYTYNSYRIKKDCILLMEKKIQEFDSTFKSEEENAVGYYNFIIIKNGVKTKYITNNKANSRRLIYILIKEIDDSSTQRKAIEKFNAISPKMW